MFCLEEDTYRAAISTADLTVGETYDVSAVARGEDQFESEPELLGVSDGGRLTVTTTATMAIAANRGDVVEGNETELPSDSNETDTNQSNDSLNTDSSAGDETTSSATEDGETSESVIEPTGENDTTAANDGTDSIPVGVVPLLAMSALLGGLLIRAVDD